jgi:hypothetical protein
VHVRSHRSVHAAHLDGGKPRCRFLGQQLVKDALGFHSQRRYACSPRFSDPPPHFCSDPRRARSPGCAVSVRGEGSRSCCSGMRSGAEGGTRTGRARGRRVSDDGVIELHLRLGPPGRPTIEPAVQRHPKGPQIDGCKAPPSSAATPTQRQMPRLQGPGPLADAVAANTNR